MNHRKIFAKVKHLFSFSIISIFLMIFLIAVFNPLNQNENNVKTMNKGWQNDQGLLIDLPIKENHITKNKSQTITKTLSSDFNNKQTIVFYSQFQDVKVFLDEELIYNYSKKENIFLLKASPSTWNYVDIPEKSEGKTIRIEIESPYSFYSGKLNTIQYGNGFAVNNKIERNNALGMYLNVMIFILGIFIFLAENSLANIYKSKGIRYIDAFILFLGIWLILGSRSPHFIFVDPVLTILVHGCFLRLLPLPLLMYFRLNSFAKQKRVYEYMTVLFLIDFVICLCMQFFGLKDFEENMLVWTILIIISTLYMLNSVKYIGKKLHGNLTTIYRGINIVLLISILIEIISCMCYSAIEVGTYIRIAISIYIVGLVYIGTICVMESTNDEVLVQERMQRSRMQLMISQMQPHFMYNTLSAIQELCYTDPNMAADTIVKFSNYLRANVDFLDHEEMIHFRQELKHIRNYIEIQKIRFGDNLVYEEYLEETNFMLPPLTIQPIIENAVQHGVRKRKTSGIVKLITKVEGDQIMIQVTDNGYGFEEKVMPDKGFHSFDNVKYRLETLVNANIEIDSTKNGTRVTIILNNRGRYAK